MYERHDIFRSTIVMARHGFGRGEYKYWSYPLPEIVAGLRTALYSPLAAVANRWNQSMKIDGKRSTNPIWRRDPFFGQVVSCNRKTKPVVIDNGAAGKKSSAWSMNSKRTDQTGRSFVEGGV
jgi:hypothetical protein